MSTTEGQIFNIPEPTGAEWVPPLRFVQPKLNSDHSQVRFETTAAEAERDAQNSEVAREIEHNAESIQQAAQKAALAASVSQSHIIARLSLIVFLQSIGPSLTGENDPVDEFQYHAQQTTNAAVTEGQADFESAKATGAGYLSQAQDLASGVLASAQV